MRYIAPVSLFIATLLLALFQPVAYSYVPFVIVCGLIVFTLFLKLRYQQGSASIHVLETNMKTPIIQLTLHKKHHFRVQGTYHIVCQHTISGEQQHFSHAFSTVDKKLITEIPVTWHYCGQMQIVQATVTFTDPLSWIQVSQTIPCTESSILWPTFQAIDLEQLTGTSYQMMGADAGANERILPYVPGDAIQSIHWSLSAKLQTVMVQKPAFAETNSEQLALYFNDIHQVQQYDSFMNDCYSLLLHELIEEVTVWTGEWQSFSVKQPHEISTLFHYLLSQPIAHLYAPSLPEDSHKIIRYEGEQAA